MGVGGISIWQLGLILIIVLLIFGTKKLRGLGGDLGGAIKGFKKAMKEDSNPETSDDQETLEKKEDDLAHESVVKSATEAEETKAKDKTS